MEENIVTLKTVLANFIFLIHAFGQHYTLEDCLALKVSVIDK